MIETSKHHHDRIQIHLRVRQRRREFASTVGWAVLGQLMGEIISVVGGHPGGGTSPTICQIQAVLTRKTLSANRFRFFTGRMALSRL